MSILVFPFASIKILSFIPGKTVKPSLYSEITLSVPIHRVTLLFPSHIYGAGSGFLLNATKIPSDSLEDTTADSAVTVNTSKVSPSSPFIAALLVSTRTEKKKVASLGIPL